MYEKYVSLNASRDAYRKIFDEVNNKILLEKALELGEITVIEYFMEMSYFDDAQRIYLETEHEFYQIISELNKYKL